MPLEGSVRWISRELGELRVEVHSVSGEILSRDRHGELFASAAGNNGAAYGGQECESVVAALCCVVTLVELSLVKVWMKLKLIGGVVCEFFLRVKSRVTV